ncbi:uncharacterized protein LOC144094490 [Amblyomma americanum]
MTAGTLARFLEGQSQRWKGGVAVTLVAMLLLLLFFFNFSFRTDRGDEAQEEIQHEDEINTDNPGPKDHSAEVDKLRTTPSLILTTRQPMRRTAGTGKKKTSRAARPSTTWSLSTNFKSSITTTPSTTTAETTTQPKATPMKTTTATTALSTTQASTTRATTSSTKTTLRTTKSTGMKTATALPPTTSTKTTTTHSMTTKAATTLATKTSTITTTTQSTTTKATTTLPTTPSTKTTATQSTPSKATTTLPTKTSTKTTTTKTTTKAATTPPTKTSTKTATTQSTTTKASTTLPTTTSTKTTDIPSRGPWLQQNLLCTVNHFMNPTVVAPDDGLCDFMIFDSFFKDDKYNIGVPYEDGFHNFLQFSRNHVKTQYGVGFGYHEYKDHTSSLEQMLANNHSRVRGDIVNLWNQNISHFGYVDVGHVYFGTNSLRVIEMLHGTETMRRPTYTLLTVPMLDAENWKESLTHSMRLTKHTPDALIAVSHLAENDFNSGYSCRIMPPMFLDKPVLPEDVLSTSSYTYSMATVLSNLKKFASLKRPKSALFVTVPVYAKWYTFEKDEYGFESECGVDYPPSLIGSVVEVCNKSQYNTTYVAGRNTGVISVCRDCQTVLTYENEESYRYKPREFNHLTLFTSSCAQKKSLPGGWAVMGSLKSESSQNVWRTLLPPAIIIMLFGLLLAFFVILSRKEGPSHRWKGAIALTLFAMVILLSIFFKVSGIGQSWLEQQNNTDYPDDDVPDRPLKSNTQQRTTPKEVTLKPKPTSALTTNASRNADTSSSTVVLATTSEPQTVTWSKADALTPKPTSALTVHPSKIFADTTTNGATKTPMKTDTKTTLETVMKTPCTAMNISKNTATKTAAKSQTTTYTNTIAVTPQMNLTRPDKKNATKASTLTSMKTVAKTATIITPEITEPTTKSRNQPTNGTDSTEANVTKEGSKSEEQRPTTLSVARTPAFTSPTVTRISQNANASSTTHSLNTVSESLAANISYSDKALPKPTAPVITTLASKTSTNTATRADTSITTNSATNTFEQFSMKTITKLVTQPSMNTATKTSNATSYTAMKTSANTAKTTTNNNATLTSTKISKTKTSTKTTTRTSTKTSTNLGTNTSTETTASPFTKTSKKAITKTTLTSTKVFTNTPTVTSAKASTKNSTKTATKTSTKVSTFTQASIKTSSPTSAKTTTKTSMNTSTKTSVHVLLNITTKITQKASTKTFGKNSTKFTIIVTKPTTKTSASTSVVATTKPSTKSVSDATSNTFTQTSTKVATKSSSKTPTTNSTFTAKKTSDNTATKISATTSLKTSTKTSTRLPAKTSTKTTTTESEPQLKQSLLCTVNHFVKPSMVPPDDGLCDITLYDSFFKNGTYNLGPPYDDSFQHFLEFAAQHVKTEYGAAFAYAYKEITDPIAIALKENPSKVQADLINLWKHKISHFGCVDIGHVYVHVDRMERVVKVLKQVFDMLKEKWSAQRPSYTLLTIPMYHPEEAKWLRDLHDVFRRTRHTPHGLIAVVHLAEKDFFSGYACRIMPPMFLHRPQIPAEFSNTSPYTYSMSDEHAALEQLARRERRAEGLFVTVPLFGKWYTFDEEEYGFGTVCGVDDPPSFYGSIVEVCKKPEYNTTYLASNHTGVVSGCNQCKKVLTYDNEQSYRYKVSF